MVQRGRSSSSARSTDGGEGRPARPLERGGRTTLGALVLAAASLGCQPPCEERCASTQRRCADGAENPAICADQCTIVACVDCFRCLDEEAACPGESACEPRCRGCARTAP